MNKIKELSKTLNRNKTPNGYHPNHGIKMPTNTNFIAKIILVLSSVAGLLAILFFTYPGLKKYLTFEYLSFLVIIAVTVPFLFSTKHRYWRSIILLLSLALFGFLQFACPRPTGSIELILLNFMKGKPILWHLIIKIAFIGILSFVFARYYCGWICPKGAIQEFIFNPRLKIKISDKLDKILKFGKYITLALLILSPLLFHFKLFRFLGPFKVIFNLDGTLFLVIFLAIVLLASMFIERAYCRYFCPFGALLSLISFFSFNKIKIQNNKCTSCNLCTQACPTNAIEKATKENPHAKIHTLECIACKECVAVCPSQAISYKFNK